MNAGGFFERDTGGQVRERIGGQFDHPMDCDFFLASGM